MKRFTNKFSRSKRENRTTRSTKFPIFNFQFPVEGSHPRPLRGFRFASTCKHRWRCCFILETTNGRKGGSGEIYCELKHLQFPEYLLWYCRYSARLSGMDNFGNWVGELRWYASNATTAKQCFRLPRNMRGNALNAPSAQPLSKSHTWLRFRKYFSSAPIAKQTFQNPTAWQAKPLNARNVRSR